MVAYSQIYTLFWTDQKVDDDFTPEDKLFYLYLLTNPHVNICGCYGISNNQMCRETGFDRQKVEALLSRMERVHNVIRYSASNKEVLLINWYKYNWSTSEKTLQGIYTAAENLKTAEFREYVQTLASGQDTEIPHTYPIQGVSENEAYPIQGVSKSPVTVTDTASVTVSVPEEPEKGKGAGKGKNSRRRAKPGKVEQNKALLDAVAQAYGFSDQVIGKLSEWMRYKGGEKKFCYQETGMNALLSQVQKYVQEYGEEAVLDVITLSMSNGWQGIIWDKIQRAGGRAGPSSGQNRYGATFMDMYQERYGDES